MATIVWLGSVKDCHYGLVHESQTAFRFATNMAFLCWHYNLETIIIRCWYNCTLFFTSIIAMIG